MPAPPPKGNGPYDQREAETKQTNKTVYSLVKAHISTRLGSEPLGSVFKIHFHPLGFATTEGSKTTVRGVEDRWERSTCKHALLQQPLRQRKSVDSLGDRLDLGTLKIIIIYLDGYCTQHRMQEVPLCVLPFHSTDIILWWTQVCNFDEVQFIYFFFYCLCFWCHIQEITAKANIMNFTPAFSSKSFTVLGLWFILS